MDSEIEISNILNNNHKFIKNKNIKYSLKLFIIFIVLFVLFDIIINIKIFNFSIKSNVKLENILLKLKNDMNKEIIGLKEFIKIKEFNEVINEKFKQKQINFCNNISKYLNKDFENQIKLSEVHFNNITYNMFVYKENDIVSNSISDNHHYEKDETYNILDGLNFYSKKKNLINNNIYIIDVGGNVGWYTLILGKLGYNVVSFEPLKMNYYILNKNYCLNKEINVTLINKGLFPEEKRCYIYSPGNNIGDGITNCNGKFLENSVNNGEIILTKLSNYMSYFENKNLAMIKMDIEGLEGKAFESGIEFITNYHVPFIFMEFNPKYLRGYGTNPQEFLENFINNGYKINLLNFFEKTNYDIKFLIESVRNLYLVYTPFLN
jgi:FkbM family methyltransferase